MGWNPYFSSIFSTLIGVAVLALPFSVAVAQEGPPPVDQILTNPGIVNQLKESQRRHRNEAVLVNPLDGDDDTITIIATFDDFIVGVRATGTNSGLVVSRRGATIQKGEG